MAALGHILWRLVVMTFGMLLAGAAALATIVVSGPITMGAGQDGQSAIDHTSGNIVVDVAAVILGAFFLGFIDLLLGTIVIMMMAGPVLIIAGLIGEAFRLRSWVYYAIAGLAAGVLPAMTIGLNSTSEFAVPTTFAACVLAGLTYWLVAGTSAGFFQRDPGQPRSLPPSDPV